MKCASCGRKIPTDEETWVQGEALCQPCWKQSLKKTWGWTWIILGIVVGVFLLLFVAPFIFMCIFTVAAGAAIGHGR